MVALWIVFIISSAIFVFLFGKLIRATRKSNQETFMDFSYVYAGEADGEQMDASAVNMPVSERVFLDENGSPIDLKKYDGYLVKGNSMELANIKEGDILLSAHDFTFEDNTPLPNIFVLEREHPQENEAKYKLRRVWAVAYLSEVDPKDVIRGIMAHPEFIKLKQNNNVCVDDQQMEDEFLEDGGRLSIYKKEHPNWSKEGHNEARVAISTTLRKETEDGNLHTEAGKHISFSIHPASLVVGQVVYAYPPRTIQD